MPEVVTMGETMAVMAPTEPGPLRYVASYRLRMAGAESNLAVGLCKLGHTAGWISRLGDDEMGRFVLNAVRAEGVDTRFVRWDDAHRTGLMLKEMGARETRVYYYRENSAASRLDEDALDEKYLKGASVLHLTGITPVLSESCARAADRAAQLAEKHGVPLSFDPNIRKKLWQGRDYRERLRRLLFSARIALLGVQEAEELLGTGEPEAVVRLLREKGAEWIALKNGAEGAWVADRNTLEKIPPFPCRAVDPIGAGDAFNAGFLAGILEGRGVADCGRMGCIAGAMTTETPGDVEGLPSRQQLLMHLENRQETFR